MNRFEIRAAYILGVLLPLLETLRRGTHFGFIPSYVDDYIAGALLLWAAWATTRNKQYGRPLLAGAWGIVCGGAYCSFFGQIERNLPTDVSGYSNRTVVIIKGALFLVAIVAFICSIKRLTTDKER